MHLPHISTGVRQLGHAAHRNGVTGSAGLLGWRTREGGRRAAVGTKLAPYSGMPVPSRLSFCSAVRPSFGWHGPHRRLAIGAVLLVLAALTAGAVRAAEPAGAVPTGRALSTPPGTVQLVAVPAVLVHPVSAGAVVVRALAPQTSQPQGAGAAVEQPAAGLGTMLLSMMALVGWIALRRR
jgi:hypothetical protein